MLGLGRGDQIRIFGGSASTKFVKKMCDYLGCPVGDNTTLIFSEGNTFVRINESIRDKDVYLVQNTNTKGKYYTTGKIGSHSVCRIDRAQCNPNSLKADGFKIAYVE